MFWRVHIEEINNEEKYNYKSTLDGKNRIPWNTLYGLA